jgi:acetyl esterase
MADAAARERLAKMLAPLHLKGLRGFRRAATGLLAGRDRNAPTMREVRLLSFGDAGPPDARLLVPHGAEVTGDALIYFHGGGFVLGEIDNHDALCRRLAQAARMRVVLATYRLAPEHAFPAQMQDAETVVRWVFDHAAKLGIDPGAVALGGDSAGGYLAIAVTALLNHQTPGRIKALALLYPLLQLDDGRWANTVFTDSRVLGRIAVRYINAQFAGQTPPNLLHAEYASLPSAVIAVGGAMDPVRPDVMAFAHALRSAGVSVELFHSPGMPHGFGNLTHLAPAARDAIQRFGASLGRIMGRSSPA